MIATLKKVHRIGAEIYTFWFETNRPVNNEPGQYIELTVPHNNPDNRGITRKFTVFSSPTEPLMAITTRIKPESSSYKKALLNYKLGSKFSYTEPMGDFILPMDSELPLLFIAGGIGITPFRSIIKWLKTCNQKRNIQLIYAVKDKSEFIDKQLLSYVPTTFLLTDASPDWQGDTSKLTVKNICKFIDLTPQTFIYLSGSKGLVIKLKNNFFKQGTSKNKIITDIFSGY